MASADRGVKPSSTAQRDEVWHRYDAAERRRRIGRHAMGYLWAGTAAAGAFLAVSQLRRAHLYRQEFGEGLGFFWVAALMVAAWIVAVGAWCLLLRLGPTEFERKRSTSLLAAALLVWMLGASAAAVWVEWHGSRCVGRC